MTSTNTIIAKASKEQLSIHPERAFQLLDAAKNVGRYDLANAVFAYLQNSGQCYNGIEVCPYEEEEAPILEGLGVCISDEDVIDFIREKQYFSLLTIGYMGRYGCIPLPMVQPHIIKGVVDKIQQQYHHHKVVERLDHDRDVDASISIQETIWTDKEVQIFSEYDCSNVLL